MNERNSSALFRPEGVLRLDDVVVFDVVVDDDVVVGSVVDEGGGASAEWR